MNACVEEYDEEMHDDPIKLCFKLHHSNSCCYLGSSMHKEVDNMSRETQIETIDLTGINEPVNIKMPKPLTVKSDVCYQIKQLAIEIVDFKKFPWYYKKCIKYCNNTDDINSTNGIVVCENQNNANDMCMKIKYDNNKGQWKVQEGKKGTSPSIKDRVVPKVKFHRNSNKIDFKRNKGLVGLTITPKFVPEEVVVKKEEESCTLIEVNNETDEVIVDKPININVLSVENDKVTKEASVEIAVKEKSVESIDIKHESNEITEIPKKTSDQSNKVQSTEILKNFSKDVCNLKGAPKKNKINSVGDTKNLDTHTKLVITRPSSEKSAETSNTSKNKETNVYFAKRDSETDARLQKKDYKERKQSVEIKAREIKSNIDKTEPKKKIRSPTNKKVSDTIKVRKDIFNEVKSVSEHKVAVIDSTSKHIQNIKKCVDKAMKLGPKRKLKTTNIEAPKCNDPKPLDMPILTEDCDGKSVEPSIHRTSFKDSIVFENDGIGIEDIAYKETPGKKLTKSLNQKTLEKNSSEVSKTLQANNSLSIAGNAPTTTATVVPITAHAIPVVSYNNVGVSKPRVKYTPMTKDYAIPTNMNEVLNPGTHGRSSQSLLRYSASASANNAVHNAQNGSIVQLLSAPQKTPNMGTIQHRLPLQQMPHYSAPPSYPSNYPTLPSYATAVSNNHFASGYRTCGHNTGDVNSNLRYMYPGYSAPLPPHHPQQAPQWQQNMNFNPNQPLHYQVNLHNPNTSSVGWNNGYMRGVNIGASSAPCMPTNTTTGNPRVSFDILRAHTQPVQPVPNDGKSTKSKTPKTPIRKNAKKDNHASLERVNELVVINNSSTKNTLKRPYDYGVHEVTRVQYSALETELAKRPKTAPLVNEHARKVKPSGYSPPILPIPTNETVLSNFFSSRQPSDAQQNTRGDAKYGKRKMSTDPMDKSRKISIEDYKKRICKNDSADLYNSPVRTGGNTIGTGHQPNCTAKKSKYGNYYLEQDLGYSSDTTVKL